MVYNRLYEVNAIAMLLLPTFDDLHVIPIAS